MRMVCLNSCDFAITKPTVFKFSVYIACEISCSEMFVRIRFNNLVPELFLNFPRII